MEMASGRRCETGSTHNAIVHNQHGVISGNWWESGSHTATFFSGTRNSEDYCTCP